MIIITLLLLYLAVAAAMDLMWRRVKNLWILYGILSGFTLSFVDSGIWGDGGCQLDMGFPGLILSLLGFLLPLPLLFLYRYHFLGAGDIKLLMVMGIYLGALHLWKVLPFMILSAGVLALISLIYNKKTIFKKLHYMPLAPAMFLGLVIWRLSI